MMLKTCRINLQPLVAIHTSLWCLKCLAGTRWSFSFVIKDSNGEVVGAVRLEARQTSLATIPTERQNQFLLLCVLLTSVVHLEKTVNRVSSYTSAVIILLTPQRKEA